MKVHKVHLGFSIKEYAIRHSENCINEYITTNNINERHIINILIEKDKSDYSEKYCAYLYTREIKQRNDDEDDF